MFVVKEVEDRLRKAENDKDALKRDLGRAEGRAKQVEMNQETVSSKTQLNLLIDAKISG